MRGIHWIVALGMALGFGLGAVGAAPVPQSDVLLQAQALQPAFAADLDQAASWNRYTINATLDPAARTLDGDQQLVYTNRDTVALNQLFFRLFPNITGRGAFGGRLDVRNVQVDGKAVPLAYEARRTLLRVNLPTALAPGQSATVALGFEAETPLNGSARLYGAFNRQGNVFALASSYPLVAQVRGGVWDIGPLDYKGDLVNSDTALYDVTLRAPADWTLATTGVAVDRSTASGTQTTRFVSGPQRDFMISAVQLPVLSAMVDGTTINAYYPVGNQAGGQNALRAASDALRTFNKRFGSYPLRELDVVPLAATTFLGVEYPGIVYIEQNLYTRSSELEIIVAHEVAHQWWYSQIGNDVQRAAWIDEGLASYAQMIYREETSGPDAARRELQGFRQGYASVRAAGRDAPMAQANARFTSANYYGVVYAKSALFFHTLRRELGDGGFDLFLHDLYSRNRYGVVGEDDVRASAEAVCRCDLQPLFRTWVETTARVSAPE